MHTLLSIFHMPTLLHFLTRWLSILFSQTLRIGGLSHLSGGHDEHHRKAVLLNKLLTKQFMNTSLKLKLLGDFDFILYQVIP
jgi:hypothetical protein